jgi:short-subunit dehydrogenase
MPKSRSSKNILIIAATSTIVYSCIKLLNDLYNVNFFLIARDSKKMALLKADIETRSETAKVQCIALEDFLCPIQISLTLKDIFKEAFIDIAIIAQGELNHDSSKSLGPLKKNFSINSLSPIIFCEEISSYFEKQMQGHLVVFGSVAGDRGRKSNYVYGSAKAAVEVYLQGLTHRFFKTKIFVSLIKPAPTLTPMTEFMTKKIFLESPDYVAKFIVKGILKRRQIIYAPPKWKYIMFLIRNLPKAIFNRLDI